MFKSFRVAGFAAAALLCSANSAAATDRDVPAAEIAAVEVAAVDAAALVPALPAPAAPVISAEPATLTSVPAPSTPEASPLARSRPDRVRGSAPVPEPGVTGIASARRSLSDLVAEHERADVTNEEFECLASAVYFESRGEPLEGQLAVAEVILNRVRSGRFRSTVCDVVKQPSQFSFVRRGVIPAAPRESVSWRRAVAIAHIALNNLADATGDDSLFFHATYVNPRWGRPRIARIGNHIFYR